MDNQTKSTTTPEAGTGVRSADVVEETTKSRKEVDMHNNGQSTAGTIVLQWLSYAFWGWLIAALVWLMAVILTNAIIGRSVEGVVPYAMAATIVLLPIAFVTDFFYRRYEPIKKTGAASVIMVIHAVIFALFGIGVLITAVFIGLSMVLNDGDSTSKGETVALLTTLFAAILYGFAFLRTINPFKTKKVASMFGLGMLVLTVLLIILGIAGPLVKSLQVRDDRRIEKHLSSVKSEVDSYIQDNKKLPSSLEELDYSDQEEARSLVTNNLVTYKKVSDGTASESSSISRYSKSRKTFRYELCVDYKAESSYRSVYGSSYRSREESSYKSYLSTSSHGEGPTCYKLQEVVYDSSSDD